MSSLHKKAFGGLAILFLVMASLLFAAAGTLRYWQAWLFLAIYFAVSLATGQRPASSRRSEARKDERRKSEDPLTSVDASVSRMY